MPQMMPMMWTFITFITFITLIFSMLLIYFLNLFLPNYSMYLYKFSMKSWLWKW